MLAYAMPVAMVITAVAAPAGSLRPADIVEVQHAVPMAIVQPLAFAIWLPAVMAVCFMPPFDLPQATGELGGGAFSEYRGLDAALVALAQRVLVLGVSGMTAALFLSGWHGPLLPPALWMAVKTAAVAALLLWVGRRVPRLEVDRVASLAWKFANPLAILAIVIAGLITLLFYR
jgi:NADH-quinone oxidoreductase subunit H